MVGVLVSGNEFKWNTENKRKLKAIVRSFVFAFRIFASLLRLIGARRSFANRMRPASFRSVHLLCKQSERKQIRIFAFNHSLQPWNPRQPNRIRRGGGVRTGTTKNHEWMRRELGRHTHTHRARKTPPNSARLYRSTNVYRKSGCSTLDEHSEQNVKEINLHSGSNNMYSGKQSTGPHAASLPSELPFSVGAHTFCPIASDGTLAPSRASVPHND